MFKLIPVGTNGLYPQKDKPTSCYLVQVGERNIVIDMGSGSFSRLAEIVAPEKIDLIIVSHFHLDHCADLGVFGYYMQRREKKRLFCPDDPHAAAVFGLEKLFDATYISEGKTEIYSGIFVEFLRTNHPVKTYAVRITADGKTLSYTADTNVCDNLERLFSSSDLVISDSAFLYKDWAENKPHISASHCGRLSAKYGVKTLLSHLDPAIDKREVLKEAREFSELTELIENDKIYYL